MSAYATSRSQLRAQPALTREIAPPIASTAELAVLDGFISQLVDRVASMVVEQLIWCGWGRRRVARLSPCGGVPRRAPGHATKAGGRAVDRLRAGWSRLQALFPALGSRCVAPRGRPTAASRCRSPASRVGAGDERGQASPASRARRAEHLPAGVRGV